MFITNKEYRNIPKPDIWQRNGFNNIYMIQLVKMVD